MTHSSDKTNSARQSGASIPLFVLLVLVVVFVAYKFVWPWTPWWADLAFIALCGIVIYATRSRDTRQTETPAEWRSVTVIAAVDRDGLSAEDAMALRNIIVSSAPLFHQFLNPGTFVICFSGDSNGTKAANQLSSELSAFALRAELVAFGIGIEVGTCLASLDADGQFTSQPVGETISRAMQTATTKAANVL